MTTDPSGILELEKHPDYNMAVPTNDHYLPLLYLAGLANAPATALLRGYSMGSLSMTAYGLRMEALDEVAGAGAATLPAGVPADGTNT